MYTSLYNVWNETDMLQMYHVCNLAKYEHIYFAYMCMYAHFCNGYPSSVLAGGCALYIYNIVCVFIRVVVNLSC